MAGKGGCGGGHGRTCRCAGRPGVCPSAAAEERKGGSAEDKYVVGEHRLPVENKVHRPLHLSSSIAVNRPRGEEYPLLVFPPRSQLSRVATYGSRELMGLGALKKPIELAKKEVQVHPRRKFLRSASCPLLRDDPPCSPNQRRIGPRPASQVEDRTGTVRAGVDGLRSGIASAGL